MPQSAALARSAKSVTALAEEYRAVREATLTVAGVQPSPGYDFSAIGLAYRQLKERNHLAVMINRAVGRHLIPSLPIEVQINNIGFCNLRCPQCLTHGADDKHEIYQDKSFTMTRAALENIAALNFPHARKVATSGLGEGLLHKDLDTIVAAAWRFGNHIFTNSNGTTLLPKIIGGLFGITELRLSLDGATPAAFEAVRRGAKFHKVMRNVVAMTRANELLPEQLRLAPTVNFGICASNIRDMPLMVDLCIHLGLRGLFGFRIDPTHPNYMDDDINKYPAYYKHYYLQAMQRARGRPLQIALPEPLPGIAPDASAGPSGDSGMIVTGVDDAYYQRQPSFDRLIDETDLAPEVEAMMRAALEAGIARHAAAKPTPVRQAAEHARQLEAELIADIQRGIQSLPADELARLRAMHRSDRKVDSCQFLQAHLIYNPTGTVSPCCSIEIDPVGQIDTPPKDIFRGEKMGRLLEEFRTGQLRPGCAGCVMRHQVTERELFPLAIN